MALRSSAPRLRSHQIKGLGAWPAKGRASNEDAQKRAHYFEEVPNSGFGLVGREVWVNLYLSNRVVAVP